MAPLSIKAYYGSVIMKKAYCRHCKTYAFIMDGCYSCCDRKYVSLDDEYLVKRETQGLFKRMRLPRKIKRKILEEQDGLCFYCGSDLNGYYSRRGKIIKIKTVFDHVDSWIFSRNNAKSNMAASCSICNGFKSDKHFETYEEIVEYIHKRRKTKKIIYLGTTDNIENMPDMLSI